MTRINRDERCDRCFMPLTVSTMSRFNKDIICWGCERKEREHQRYNLAKEEEAKQIKAGNYNFAGIGKPADL